MPRRQINTKARRETLEKVSKLKSAVKTALFPSLSKSSGMRKTRR